MIVKKSPPTHLAPSRAAPSLVLQKGPTSRKWGLLFSLPIPMLYFEKIVLPGIFSSLFNIRFSARFAPRIAT